MATASTKWQRRDGNYTEERDRLLGSMTVDEIIDEIYRRRAAEPSEPEQAPE